jgi:hypothetical protein
MPEGTSAFAKVRFAPEGVIREFCGESQTAHRGGRGDRRNPHEQVRSKETSDLGMRDCPSARKTPRTEARLVHFKFVKKSHDRGATFSSLSEPSTANSRSCVSLIMRSSSAAVPAIPISAAVPATISSPSSPCLVVVPLAVGISRVPALAIRLLRGMAMARDHVLGHCGPREHGAKNCGSAKKSEFGHGS